MHFDFNRKDNVRILHDLRCNFKMETCTSMNVFNLNLLKVLSRVPVVTGVVKNILSAVSILGLDYFQGAFVNTF